VAFVVKDSPSVTSPDQASRGEFVSAPSNARSRHQVSCVDPNFAGCGEGKSDNRKKTSFCSKTLTRSLVHLPDVFRKLLIGQ